jgi:2,4-dienoyl-CoA reductase-like NADH-dependent reductase (Old Yellow Enzyme family)
MTSRLFEKIELNNKAEVPGKLVVAPLTLFSSNPDGTINNQEREYLKRRGVGIGLYILGATAVSEEGVAFPGQPRAISEKDLPSLSERAKLIKDQGALAINQIHHGGYMAMKQYSKLDPLAPSAAIANECLKTKGLFDYEIVEVKELTDEQIRNIIKGYANATELSLKAGFDGVEIHGANNYLIQQFYSPYTNRRTDEWGGSDEKRMSFPLKVIEACCEVREKYKKPEFIIGYRLSPEEPYETGITMDETIKLVKVLITKPLQYIHISQWNFFKKARRGEGAGTERLKIIHEITKGKMPLIGCGSLKSEIDLNKALDSGLAEFIGVGGASMMNRDFGLLLKENKGNQLELELDPDHPEKYAMPSPLWNMCLAGGNWLPPLKGKKHEEYDV